jgi:hypothetical protein
MIVGMQSPKVATQLAFITLDEMKYKDTKVFYYGKKRCYPT